MAYRLNAKLEEFESIEFFNTPMLFSMFRIDRSSVPGNMYMYEVRHSDYDDADPVEIKGNVLVNFWGTLISSRLSAVPHLPGLLTVPVSTLTYSTQLEFHIL